jgi:K+-sensing histidine kinase KdpD
LLFEPYKKLESGKKMNPTGNGLGLSICKKVLKEFDSNIWIDNPVSNEES